MTTTSTTYSTNYSSSGITTTTTTVVKPDIYNDKGCDTERGCGVPYIVWPKCIVDLYHGINTCQIVYILDQNGEPLDLDRLDSIDIHLFNEFDCEVLDSSYGMNVENIQTKTESLQTKYKGCFVDITPDNFYNSMDKFFDLYNVRVLDDNPDLICPDETKAIVLGDTNDDTTTFGQIIFNPISYNGDLYIELVPNKHNVGDAICLVNGLPQAVFFNKKNRLVNILDSIKEANLSLLSVDSEFTQTILMLDEIRLYCTKGFKNKGALKICYVGSKIPKTPSRLTAEVILTFSDYDEEHPGEIFVISCVHLANVRRSRIISEIEPADDDDPDYSGSLFKVVDTLPEPSWNTMNRIFLVPSKNPKDKNIKVEYVTLKKKVNNAYTYYWEKLGEKYDLIASQEPDSTSAINLTNNEETDSVIIKHKSNVDGHGSMIDFDVDGNKITANITKIDGGVL